MEIIVKGRSRIIVWQYKEEKSNVDYLKLLKDVDSRGNDVHSG